MLYCTLQVAMLSTCFVFFVATAHGALIVDYHAPGDDDKLDRNRRQQLDMENDFIPEPSGLPEFCDFGEGRLLKLCTWSNPPNVPSNLLWKTGRGSTSNWLGGPRTDHTGANAN
ncbi:uncharacterized protein LOC111087943, partial [Limulus polyphemus]|uniref:Uncharacterized protein LOC111087943 n=1 Tax=Limulus polyphemus TaxID=6850 RepID=A0ABM1T8C9_LIMPO